MLFAPFFSDTRVDQNSFITGLNEKTVHVHANAILIVRRVNAGPEIARHDPKHRATIKSELAVGDDFDSVITEIHKVLSVGFRMPALYISLFVCGIYGKSLRCKPQRTPDTTPNTLFPRPYFLPLGVAGLAFAGGALCDGPWSGIMPGGIPCCICCGGGCGTEKFSAIVMWLP